MMAANGKKVWMDGRLVDFADARVHVLTHTLHYGVGVFEGIRAYPTSGGGAVFRLREHVDRLITSARFYHMPIPYSAEEIERAILDTQAARNPPGVHPAAGLPGRARARGQESEGKGLPGRGCDSRQEVPR